MKKIILYTILLAVPSLLFAQTKSVGVNTENPEQLFHIDPKGDTKAANNTTKVDDVVISKDGMVGLGTTTPNRKLQVEGNTKISGSMTVKDTTLIEGVVTNKRIGVKTNSPEVPLHIANTNNGNKFRMSDTSESSGHILTCDEDGQAFWDGLRPMSSVVNGALQGGVRINKGGSSPVSITKDSLSLSPGRWLIIAKSATTGNLNGYNMYMRLYAEKDFNGMTNDGEISSRGVRLMSSASTSESRTGSAYLCTPNLLYIVSIPKKAGTEPGTPEYKTKFWIELVSTSTNGTTTTSFGEMPFYALRIDRQN